MVEAHACLERNDEKKHCFYYFQFSPYWAHPEAILLALLSDDNPDMRHWAVQKIIKVRQTTDVKVSEYFKDDVRTWKKVTLLFNPMPVHYKDMIGMYSVFVPFFIFLMLFQSQEQQQYPLLVPKISIKKITLTIWLTRF